MSSIQSVHSECSRHGDTPARNKVATVHRSAATAHRANLPLFISLIGTAAATWMGAAAATDSDWEVCRTPTGSSLWGITHNSNAWLLGALNPVSGWYSSVQGRAWWPVTNALPPASVITYAGGFHVAASWSGRGGIWISTNRTDWQICSNAPAVAFRGFAEGGGRLVAVGDNLHFGLCTNGTDWTFSKMEGGASLYSVAYGNGRFVAVGSAGKIVSSFLGREWKDQRSGTSQNLFGVTFGDGRFVAVGPAGTLLESSDGSHWVFGSTPTAAGPRYLNAVAFGMHCFVAVGERGAVWSSRTGQPWQTELSGTTNWLRRVAFGNGVFVAVGENGVVLRKRFAPEP